MAIRFENAFQHQFKFLNWIYLVPFRGLLHHIHLTTSLFRLIFIFEAILICCVLMNLRQMQSTVDLLHGLYAYNEKLITRFISVKENWWSKYVRYGHSDLRNGLRLTFMMKISLWIFFYFQIHFIACCSVVRLTVIWTIPWYTTFHLYACCSRIWCMIWSNVKWW